MGFGYLGRIFLQHPLVEEGAIGVSHGHERSPVGGYGGVVHGEGQMQTCRLLALLQRVDSDRLVIVGQDGDDIVEMRVFVLDVVDGDGVDDFIANPLDADIGGSRGCCGRVPVFLDGQGRIHVNGPDWRPR